MEMSLLSNLFAASVHGQNKIFQCTFEYCLRIDSKLMLNLVRTYVHISGHLSCRYNE